MPRYCKILATVTMSICFTCRIAIALDGAPIDMDKAFESETLGIQIKSVRIGKPEVKTLGRVTQGEDPQLLILLTFKNKDDRKILRFDPGNMFGTPSVRMKDDVDNSIRGVNYGLGSEVIGSLNKLTDINPGETVSHVEVFSLPPPKTRYVVLTFYEKAFDLKEPVSFKIPAAKFTSTALPTQAPSESKNDFEANIINRGKQGSKSYFAIHISSKSGRQVTIPELQDLMQDALGTEKGSSFSWIYEGEQLKPVGIWKRIGNRMILDKPPFNNPDPFKNDGYFAEREWSDPSGKFRFQAKFGGTAGKKVNLIDSTGKNKEVDLSKLSEQDQQWVEKSSELLPK